MRLCRHETIGIVADILVDTDIFIDHLRGANPIKSGRNRLHYSVVTRAELFAGNSASNLVIQLLGPFTEHGVDRAIAERAGRIVRETNIRMPDALIAATALKHHFSVATRNRKHFDKVRGLRVRTL